MTDTNALLLYSSEGDDATPLYGRFQECHLLLQAYQRSKPSLQCDAAASTTNNMPPAITSSLQELVLIKGHSGTGKTVLARSIADRVVREDNGFFLSGKFELISNYQNPYEVFVAAFGACIETLATTSTEDLRQSVRQAILEAVGTEGKLLTDMIPGLEDILGIQDNHHDDDEDYHHVQGGMEALNRFQLVFSKFVRAVSSVAPLVLFLDDLQWSDPASLSLLNMVLESEPEPKKSSSSLSCLLVICAMRDEDLQHSQPESLSVSTSTITSTPNEKAPAVPKCFTDFLQRVSSSAIIRTTNITLGNLNEEAVCQMVANYLDITPEMSAKLGAIIHTKSKGNPFHALQLMPQLVHYKNVVLRNDGDDSEAHHQQHQQRTTSWQEDDVLDIADVDVAGTVDDILRQKLSMIPPLAQQVIKVAACMGDCIDHPALCTVFQGNVAGVENALQALLNENFLVFDRKLGQYRFTHDRIRHVALSMIEDVRAKSYEIGHELWTKSPPTFLNTKMFIVANLLDHGTSLMTDQDERYKAAAINLEAGLRAISLAAYPDSARFLQSGIDFLKGRDGDYWNDQYDLSLNLFSAAADAELCNQHFDRVTEIAEEVFDRARTVKDKLRAYVALINSMGQRGNVQAATQVGVDVMKQLGEPLPSKVTNVSLLVEIVKTRFAIRGRSNTDLITLPPLQNEDKIAAIYVLTNLLLYTYQANSNYCPLIGARLVRLCLKYGMHKCCAFGIVVFGLAMCTLDRKEGFRLGMFGLEIVKRYRAKEMIPRVHLTFYGLVHHWMRPLKDGLAPLENSFKIGMEIGDVEFGLISFNIRAGHTLYGGNPLTQVEDTFIEGTRLMRLYRQDNMLQFTLPFLQYIHNLTGRAPIPAQLCGSVVPLFDSSHEDGSLLTPYYTYFLGIDLAFMFGDLDLAAQILEKKQRLGHTAFGLFELALESFKDALVCIAHARQNPHVRKRYMIKTAKRGLKNLTGWAKDCPENFNHKQYLLEAEFKSLGTSFSNSTKRRVKVLYDLAIEGATNEGFVHEAALANELAGDFMNRLKDSVVARKYWDDAHTLYLQWGATEKAKHLRMRTN